MDFKINGIFSTDKIGTADIVNLSMQDFSVLVSLVKENYMATEVFFGLSHENKLAYIQNVADAVREDFNNLPAVIDNDMLNRYENIFSAKYNFLQKFLAILKQQYPSFDY